MRQCEFLCIFVNIALEFALCLYATWEPIQLLLNQSNTFSYQESIVTYCVMFVEHMILQTLGSPEALTLIFSYEAQTAFVTTHTEDGLKNTSLKRASFIK